MQTGQEIPGNDPATENPPVTRRAFLRAGLLAGAALGLELASPASVDAARLVGCGAFGRRSCGHPGGAERALKLVNIHTNEGFHGVFWREGRYLPEAFSRLKTVLRDYRTGERYPMDPKLMDLLWLLQRRLDNPEPYVVFSGYRSEATNRLLRRLRHGAARHSLHLTGQACDIHLPGTQLSALHAMARRLAVGGVGYYPVSGFVHVDTGEVRHWRGV